ncbi:DUF3060 domain-containing protein [Saccharopolyspora hirsuta]|uniref:DUF3060 domain-containing protein n=1 Tax=Saccharopolyspora hirsuta TaxID=1837 RepID=A0A5M7BFE0_SACHI|nr:DUF3060 domain-containing protein [Saccharopolyspora hirsuta]KAA5825885.1 DUF3060 domain-containing protein [Saccharopolyspora hirsuta]
MQVDRLVNGSSGVRATGGARRAALLLAVAGLTALLVAGCGSGGQAAPESGETPASADAQAAPLPVVEPADEAVDEAGQAADDSGQGGGSDEGGFQGGGAPLIVKDNGAALTEDCRSRKVIVLASDADLTLHGPCSLVKVQGSNSTVEVGSAQKIIAVGTGGTVHYATGHPQVVNRGGNDVSPGGSATP